MRPQVMWTPDEQRAQVRRRAPELVQTSLEKLGPERLAESGVSGLLLRYNRLQPPDVR